ncbi:ATP-binding protein [Streptomyces zingiberis]|uniref:ATP-binding protein n=1 Tax=Streptomyces zingiberis TaxID=2053010 RepID=A0ABX1C3F6_9ACTN|nr:ATP-binding protein [Streptomyces zingiberis]NJQ02442.1 ATP-binding protein [Streptomyces zingiberis]
MTVPGAEVPVTVRTFAHRFSSTRRGARVARLLAEHRLTDWGVPRGSRAFDAAVLVIAELTSNAVLHGLVPGRDCALRLTWDTGAGVLRIEVSDTRPGRPARGEPAAECDRGRGLLLVEAVALRWGVRDRNGPGKTVWAECAAGGGRPDTGDAGK